MNGNYEYIGKYLQLSKADFFILGFHEYDVVRAFIIKDFNTEFFYEISKLEKNKNDFMNRFDPNKKQKERIREQAEKIETICTLSQFMDECQKDKKINPKANAGTTFERLCSEYFNAPQQNDELYPFYKGGDLIHENGQQSQVKFMKGKFSTFSELDRLTNK